jgi:hypothetical protein
MGFLQRLTRRGGASPPPPPGPTWPPPDAGAEADTTAPSPRAAFAAGGTDLPELWHVGTVGGQRPVWAFMPDDGATLGWWRRLHALHGDSGWWPLLLGDPGDWLFDEWSDPDADGDAEVARGLAMDVDVRLAEVVAEFTSWDGEPPHGPARPAAPTTRDDVRLSSGPGLVGLVSAVAGYEVPGLVAWTGAANHRLTGADHVAVLRRWHDRWGAELVGLAQSELEVVVSRPPQDEADVMAVAAEQYRYCPDAVEDDGAIEVFAARQVRGQTWHFWWD